MTDETKSDLPEDLQQFESLLRGCEPATPRLERDRLMYLAGRASVEAGTTSAETLADQRPSPLVREGRVRGNAAHSALPLADAHPTKTNYLAWSWPLSSAALLLLSLTLAAAILFRHAETRIVYVTQPMPDIPALVAMPSESSKNASTANAEPYYLQVRNLVLAHGVEALPDAHRDASSQRHEEIPMTPLMHQDF
jgi:hypothetical protein